MLCAFRYRLGLLALCIATGSLMACMGNRPEALLAQSLPVTSSTVDNASRALAQQGATAAHSLAATGDANAMGQVGTAFIYMRNLWSDSPEDAPRWTNNVQAFYRNAQTVKSDDIYAYLSQHVLTAANIENQSEMPKTWTAPIGFEACKYA